jgi:hypothetical protein
MGGECPRCEAERGDGRWCANCGLDFTSTVATLPAAGLADYRDVSWRARLARGWLVIVAALTLLEAVLQVGHLNLTAGKTTAGIDLAFAQQVDDSNGTVGIATLVAFCAYLFSAAFFAAWTFRAYRNVPALGGQGPRFGAGWAIGAWFVPILGLWRPKQIVDDIWRTSDPDAPATVRPDQWRDLPTPGLLAAWWGLYICSNFADGLAARQPSDTIEHDRTSTIYGLGSSVLTIAAAVLAYMVVTRVTARQRARADALRALPEPAPVSDSPPTAATAPAT